MILREEQYTLPKEIKKIIQDVQQKEQKEIEEIKIEVKKVYKGDWDVKKDEEIKFFDPKLSYEITGYRPIDKTHGLDFNPSWFTEARDIYLKTGKYTELRKGTKAYKDFWTQQYIYCREGMTVNGYTITGDHYFFLNYYQLLDVTNVTQAMAGRTMNFPKFIVAQYEYFHYLEMCKRVKKNACLMKARSLGFSEMNASLAANLYSTRRNSLCIVASYDKKKLDPTLEKIWKELSFLNDQTQGGFFKLRQVVDKADEKRASHFKIVNSQKIEEGFLSSIIGIICDDPQKLRSRRAELLIFEEGGSWPDSKKAFIQGQALTNVLGVTIGIELIGGTGGDSGASLEGLKSIFYNPDSYNVLPFRHSHVVDGTTVLTGYFLPAYSVVLDPTANLIDERGWTDPQDGIDYYNKKRALFANDPNGLLIHCAEYCFYPSEAFALEGVNKFNKSLIAEQLTKIQALKLGPEIQNGHFRYIYKNSNHKFEGGNIQDILWEKINTGKVQILEHPLWLEQPKNSDSNYDENENPEEKRIIQKTNNLYVMGSDSIDLGQQDTSEQTRSPSDFCVVVKRRAYGMTGPQYVAIYKDRPDNVNDAYKTAIALAMYYNCMINLEASRMGFLIWSRTNKFLNYFMRRPSATYPDITKRRTNQFGTPATPAIIDHQTDLIRDFVDEYCDTIWFPEMLQQLSSYNDENKKKFDIIAAMGMCELADEELTGITPKAVQQVDDTFQDFGYYFDENGIRHFGIIPKKEDITVRWNNEYSNFQSYGSERTSNPRYFL